jgi:hypothetical protein
MLTWMVFDHFEISVENRNNLSSSNLLNNTCGVEDCPGPKSEIPRPSDDAVIKKNLFIRFTPYYMV